MQLSTPLRPHHPNLYIALALALALALAFLIIYIHIPPSRRMFQHIIKAKHTTVLWKW